MRNLFIAMMMCMIVFSCNENQNSKPTESEVAKVRAAYDNLSTKMIKSLAYIQEPLSKLTDEQKASVAALLLITRIAAQQQVVAGITKTELLSKMWEEMPDLCPPLPENTLKRFGDCRDHELAYGVAMARCLDEGKSEAECEKESYGDLTAAVMCRMKEIEELPGIIGLIPGRDWPPHPIPWPIMNRVP